MEMIFAVLERISAVFYRIGFGLLTAFFCAVSLPSCGLQTQSEADAQQTERFEKDGEVTYAARTEAEHRRRVENSNLEYADNELIVMSAESLTEEEAQALAAGNGAELVGFISPAAVCQWRLPDSYDLTALEAYAENLADSEEIAEAYVNFFPGYRANSMPSSEADCWEKEKYSWGYQQVHADAVWNYIEDMKDPVNLGIIDMSFLEAPDLDYGIMKNGKTDKSDARHGTNVSEIMNAVSNNGSGIAGVYPDPTGKGAFYAYSVIDENGAGVSNVQLLNFIAEMILNDTRVINMSLGPDDGTEVFARFQSYQDGLWNRVFPEGYRLFVTAAEFWECCLGRLIDGGYEFLIVTAAGNESNHKEGDGKGTRYILSGTENGLLTYKEYKPFLILNRIDNDLVYDCVVSPEFGSSWLFLEDERVKERILCVGAHDSSRKVAKFSNMGERVDLLAPGVKIYSAVTGYRDWQWFSGTSQAAPYVTGAAACIWSLDKNLTASEVRSLLLDGELSKIRDTDIDLEKPALNLEVSMRKAKEYVDRKHGQTEADAEPEENDSRGIPVKITAAVQDTDGKAVSVSGAAATITDENGTVLYDKAVLTGTDVEFYLPEGSYTVTVEAEDYMPVTVEGLHPGTDYPDQKLFAGKFRVNIITCWAFTLQPAAKELPVNPLWWEKKDYTAQFTGYLENTLLPKYGVMPTAEKSLQAGNAQTYGSGSTIWLSGDDFNGMLAYRIADFDGDQDTEMLLIRGEGGTIAENEAWDKIGDNRFRYDNINLNMEMYEYRDGEVVLGDNRILYPSGWYQVTYNETQTGFFTFEHDGKTLIAVDSFFSMNDRASTLTLFSYDGSRFRYENGFCRWRHYNAEALYTASEEPEDLTYAPYTGSSDAGWTSAAEYRGTDEESGTDASQIQKIDEACADGLKAYGLAADDARLDFEASSGERWNATAADVYSAGDESLDVIGSVSTCICIPEGTPVSYHLFRQDPAGSLDAYR